MPRGDSIPFFVRGAARTGSTTRRLAMASAKRNNDNALHWWSRHSELLHIVFRVPDSTPVAELRDEVISLPFCHTDQELFDVAVAASYNGKSAWIAATAGADQDSSLAWRRRRGILLAGLSTGYTLPVNDAWPEDKIRTDTAALRKTAARLRWRESCAHHWWSAYLAATNPETAYAAWVLFLRSADARASLWVRDERQGQDADSDFAALKLTCVELNRAELKRNMKMRLDQCDKKFLDHAIVDEVSPWRAVANPT